jgi:hypothetical protein
MSGSRPSAADMAPLAWNRPSDRAASASNGRMAAPGRGSVNLLWKSKRTNVGMRRGPAVAAARVSVDLP